jgi:hypothetical protein
VGDKNKIDNPSNAANIVSDNIGGQFSGIFSLKPQGKYLSGARCMIRVNGKLAGFAFGISWKITTDVTEINTIDDYLPYEIAPSRISVAGTISGFRIPGGGPGNLGIQGDILSFMHQRYIEIEVRDSQTDNLIFQTKKAMITSRSENIQADNLAQMTLEFKAIGFVDEKKPVTPVAAKAGGAVSSFDNIKGKIGGALGIKL